MEIISEEQVSNEELREIYKKIKSSTNNFTFTGHSVSVIGPTGVGKTVISDAFAEPDVSEILSDREGDGLASLVPTHTHPTDIIPHGHILITAKLKQDVMSNDNYRDFFAHSIFFAGNSVLKKTNTSILTENDVKCEFSKSLKNYYLNAIEKKDNTSFAYMLSFLLETEREKAISNIVEILSEIPVNELIEIIRDVMGTAKKGTEEAQIVHSIMMKLDKDWEEYSKRFWKYCGDITNEIKKNTFDNAEYDKDNDYLFVWLTNDSPIEKRQMFLNSESKSVEFLFEKMDIYYKISDEMIEYIEDSHYAREMLKTRYGSIFFTISDSRGLFHKSDSVESAVKEAKEYIYNNNSDLVLFCISSKEEALSKKALMVLKELKASIKRNVEMIIIMPKVDELVLQLNNKVKTKTRFSKAKEEETLNSSDIINKIEERKEYVRKSVDTINLDSKRCINIREVFTYGMYTDGCPDEIIDYFNPMKVFEKIIYHLSQVSYNGSAKIHVIVEDTADDISFEWNSNMIDKMISNSILNSAIFKSSIYIPVIQNISAYKDKIGHANSAKATVNRSKNGYGHDGTIDMTWFKNVESINVQFPTKLWTIATNLINNEILKNLEITHGSFKSDKDKELFENVLNSTFSPAGNSSIMHTGRRLAARLFYINYIAPLERKGFFSYAYLLQSALRNCFSSYTSWNTGNVDEIVEAYKDVVKEVCEIIKDKYIVFDR